MKDINGEILVFMIVYIGWEFREVFYKDIIFIEDVINELGRKIDIEDNLEERGKKYQQIQIIKIIIYQVKKMRKGE